MQFINVTFSFISFSLLQYLFIIFLLLLFMYVVFMFYSFFFPPSLPLPFFLFLFLVLSLSLSLFFFFFLSPSYKRSMSHHERYANLFDKGLFNIARCASEGVRALLQGRARAMLARARRRDAWVISGRILMRCRADVWSSGEQPECGCARALGRLAFWPDDEDGSNRTRFGPNRTARLTMRGDK